MSNQIIPDRTSPESWRRWAETAKDSALYARLARGVAGDEELRELAAGAPPDQLPQNLLLGAVHYLLLGGVEHPLTEWYGTVGGSRTEGDPFPSFREFVLTHRDEIRELITTRLVQTNEVRRSAMLLPAFVTVATETGLPLAVIDAGASAGLNLLFDRYSYSYSGVAAGDPDSPLELATEVRGTQPPVGPLPEVAWRVGIDQNPVDVTDPDAARWMEALLWGDQPERKERLDAAIDVARHDPPPIETGGIVETLPGIVARAPDGAALCVTHSLVMIYLTDHERADLDELLREASQQRPIHRIAAEWEAATNATFLDLTRYDGGEAHTRRLARIHHHGDWIEWSGGHDLPPAET